ncbi:MAG: Unknown protein [uncultured Campylobacterales bacterium]|uniref:DUF2018 domain-containing protein n=1 Tax=uncultured Campylobacterales bacterium TaxID=352960 RepID=A0A6S6SGF6_9BACT|nr:MAG: Unknown protein [uncultured Campylobacterales bacterium]
MFFDENDPFFGGSVEDKFYDVIFHASRALAQKEINAMIERIAKYEVLMERANIDPTQYLEIDEESINDYYIQYMGNILSNNE